MTPLRQKLIDLLNAVDSTPGRRRLLIPGRSVYEQITDDDIEWLRREHNCEVVPPIEHAPRPGAQRGALHRGERRSGGAAAMSKGITIADLETAWNTIYEQWPSSTLPRMGPWEPVFPLAALCKRHGWSRPSDATLDFIDACGERLQRRMENHIRSLNP